MSRLLLLGAALALTVWGRSHWRAAVRLALVLLVLEGAVRKWILPGAQDLVYFVKDLLLLGAYSGYLTYQKRRVARFVPYSITVVVVAGAAYGALEVLNPALPTPLLGLLGFKAYFLYVPLLWVVPEIFASDAELARFLRRYALLSIPIALLGAAQFMSGPESPINAYARQSEALTATFGSSSYVRVTGTFSYISGYASFLLVVAMIVLANLAATHWRVRENLAMYVTLMLTILGMLMTGSRGPVVILAALFPLYWWLGVGYGARAQIVHGRILLGMGFIAALVNSVGADAVGAFYGRAANTSDAYERVMSPLLSPIRALDSAGLFGFGIGATHQAAAAVVGDEQGFRWLGAALMEDESGRVMLELGPIGFLLVYFVRVYLVVFTLGSVFRLRTALRRAVATSCGLLLLAQLPGGVVFNVTAGLYYWFFAGLALLVVRLEREERHRLRSSATGHVGTVG